MSPDAVVKIAIDPGHLEELRILAARMEAAAAAMQPAVLTELEVATATLRPITSKVPAVGPIAAAVLAGAALAGSTTRRLSRRALLTFGFRR